MKTQKVSSVSIDLTIYFFDVNSIFYDNPKENAEAVVMPRPNALFYGSFQTKAPVCDYPEKNGPAL